MKAHYTNSKGDIRVIRPFVYTRERSTREFAYTAKLPIIIENCPACFEGPKERYRIKTLLAAQEHLFPTLYHSLLTAMMPLISISEASPEEDEEKDVKNDCTSKLESHQNNISGGKRPSKRVLRLNKKLAKEEIEKVCNEGGINDDIDQSISSSSSKPNVNTNVKLDKCGTSIKVSYSKDRRGWNSKESVQAFASGFAVAFVSIALYIKMFGRK